MNPLAAVVYVVLVDAVVPTDPCIPVNATIAPRVVKVDMSSER